MRQAQQVLLVLRGKLVILEQPVRQDLLVQREPPVQLVRPDLKAPRVQPVPLVRLALLVQLDPLERLEQLALQVQLVLVEQMAPQVLQVLPVPRLRWTHCMRPMILPSPRHRMVML